MAKEIVFITGNAAKAEQVSWHLEYPVSHHKLDLIEIQSLDLDKVVRHKAAEAYKQLNQPVLVEDTSLTFSALGKLPGPLIKWFLEELGNDGLCRLLNAYPNRSAIAQVSFGYHDGKLVKLFRGKVVGHIALSPRGNEGFGWDPIFIPQGHQKTWGEMSKEEQQETSMRRIALKKLEAYLKEKV